MYKEIEQIHSVDEIEQVLKKHTTDYYFSEDEIKLVENKNAIKSLGARYLIKKSILDFLNLENEFKDIKIENDRNGKPFVSFMNKVKERINQERIQNVQVSISHSRNYITTLVVIE